MLNSSLLNGVTGIVAPMAATASMFHKSRGATQDLEKEFKKTNFKNMFFEIGLQEATSEKFSNLTTLSADEFSNKPLNRYYNVLAYDQTRVKIQLDRRDIYINANHVRIPDSGREYILTQGPLEQTVDHFWLMCHQHKTTCIVMLCRCYENSREKSAKYWPTEVGETFSTGVGIDIELLEETSKADYTTRTLRLTDIQSGISRDITQLQYINWPDFNVPESPDTFLDFLQIVRNTECFDEESGPPVIHCSAGIGRSGTFCLVDSSLVLAAKGKHLNIQIIRSILLNMRTQRMGLIQTEDQLRFSVSAIIVGCSRMTASEVVVNGSGSKTDSESADRPAGKRLSVSSHSPPSSKKRKNSDS